MIATEIGIEISFVYNFEPVGCNRQGVPFIATTTCNLRDSNKDTVGTGVSFCLKGDQFVKNVGRRIALANALKSSDFDVEARRIIWHTYLGR